MAKSTIKTIARCTPSLGDVSIWWARAAECIFWPNNTAKALFCARDYVGDEVAEVRNSIVESVLAYDEQCHNVSHLFWLDDDVLCFPGCLLELLHQDKDIVSGVYFTKMEGNLSSPLWYPESGGGTARFKPDVVEDVWGHGMGLTLVRTEVYRRMRDELLTREVDGKKEMLVDRYGRFRWYHRTDQMTELWQDEHDLTHMGMTEDLYFLGLAAKLGYKPAIVSSKHAFAFHYDKNADRGYPQKQWEMWVNGEPITWDMPGGKVIWD